MVEEIEKLLNDPHARIDLKHSAKARQLSRQVQEMFRAHGWTAEESTTALPNLKYDLMKTNVPIEIELGHERLVYADFFKFLADYSKDAIAAGVMIVAAEPEKFGHNWHNSLASTKRKLEAIKNVFLVPIWVIGIEP